MKKLNKKKDPITKKHKHLTLTYFRIVGGK